MACILSEVIFICFQFSYQLILRAHDHVNDGMNVVACPQGDIRYNERLASKRAGTWMPSVLHSTNPPCLFCVYVLFNLS